MFCCDELGKRRGSDTIKGFRELGNPTGTIQLFVLYTSAPAHILYCYKEVKRIGYITQCDVQVTKLHSIQRLSAINLIFYLISKQTEVNYLKQVFLNKNI